VVEMDKHGYLKPLVSALKTRYALQNEKNAGDKLEELKRIDQII